MFPFGILVVSSAHCRARTVVDRAAGLSEAYALGIVLGSIASITTLTSVTLLIYRRRTRGGVHGYRQRQG